MAVATALPEPERVLRLNFVAPDRGCVVRRVHLGVLKGPKRDDQRSNLNHLVGSGHGPLHLADDLIVVLLELVEQVFLVFPVEHSQKRVELLLRTVVNHLLARRLHEDPAGLEGVNAMDPVLADEEPAVHTVLLQRRCTVRDAGDDLGRAVGTVPVVVRDPGQWWLQAVDVVYCWAHLAQQQLALLLANSAKILLLHRVRVVQVLAYLGDRQEHVGQELDDAKLLGNREVLVRRPPKRAHGRERLSVELRVALLLDKLLHQFYDEHGPGVLVQKRVLELLLGRVIAAVLREEHFHERDVQMGQQRRRLALEQAPREVLEGEVREHQLPREVPQYLVAFERGHDEAVRQRQIERRRRQRQRGPPRVLLCVKLGLKLFLERGGLVLHHLCPNELAQHRVLLAGAADGEIFGGGHSFCRLTEAHQKLWGLASPVLCERAVWACRYDRAPLQAPISMQ